MMNKQQADPPSLPIWIAPMEGLTLAIFRRIWAKHFGCGLVEKYYTPFLNANHTLHFQGKEIRDILPENNAGMHVVPQILTNKPDQLAWAVGEMVHYGYDEVNFNLGCSMPQVARKKRGAGMLGDPDALDRFFEEFFELLERGEYHPRGSQMEAAVEESAEKKPATKEATQGKLASHAARAVRISVKTRIGLDDRSTADRLIAIYNRYPFDSIIIHPRLQCEIYSGEPDMEAFARMYEESVHPVVYNGDILRPEDDQRIRTQFPRLRAVMIGRGILRDPSLVRQIACLAAQSSPGSPGDDPAGPTGRPPGKATAQEIRAFHDELLDAYINCYRDEHQALSKMKELWWYMRDFFPQQERIIKKMRKCTSLDRYRAYAVELFTAEEASATISEK